MRTVMLALALVLAPAAAQAQESDPGNDPIINVPGDDRQMAAAIGRARAGLTGFFARFARPGEGDAGFTIKYDLALDGESEFIWAELVSHSDGISVAVLANNPRDPRFRLGQEVRVRDAEVVDWSYRGRDGVVRGSHTTRALLDRVPAEQAEQIRRYRGW